MGMASYQSIPQEGMQMEVLSSPAEEIMMGGEAGPGKTWTILNMDLEDLFKYHDLRVLILRRTSPDLGDLIEKAHAFYTPLGAKFSSQDSYYKKAVFTFPNGSKVILGHMQHEKDKLKYSGFEFQRLRFDEVTHFTESQYLFMFSRVRTANKRITCNIASSCNPNGIGMLWVKRRFVDAILPGEIKAFIKRKGIDVEVPIGTKNSMTRQWIPGKRYENAHVGDDYEARLSQLDERDQNALKHGIWEWSDVPNQLIKSKWWDHAISGKVKPLDNELARNRCAIGGDYAHEGDDFSVLFHGRGNAIKGCEYYEKTRTGEYAKKVYELLCKIGRYNCDIGIDCIGPGTGVGDSLEDDYGLGEIFFRATHKDPAFDEKWHGAYKFDTLRSQMWWKFKTDMENGDVDLSFFADPKSKFDKVAILQEEILAHTFEVINGKIVIISKKVLKKPDFLGRSPDYADALVLWNFIRKEYVERITHAKGPASSNDYELQSDFYSDEDSILDEPSWV